MRNRRPLAEAASSDFVAGGSAAREPASLPSRREPAMAFRAALRLTTAVLLPLGHGRLEGLSRLRCCTARPPMVLTVTGSCAQAGRVRGPYRHRDQPPVQALLPGVLMTRGPQRRCR